MIRPSRRRLSQSIRPALLTTAVAAALALAGCATPTEKPVQSTKITEVPDQSFIQGWTTQLKLQPGDAVSKMYLRDDALHVLTDQNFDYALKRDGGVPQYFNQIVPANIDIHGGPVVLADAVVFPTTFTIEVYTKKGRFVRSINLGFTVTSPAAGLGNLVFVGTDQSGGRLVEIDITKAYNPTRWGILTNGAVLGAPAVLEGDIYAGSEDGSVRACDDSRTAIWLLLDESRFVSQNKIVADLKIDAFGVYVASTDSRLYCLNRATGKVKWQYFAPVPLKTAPDVTANTVYQYVPGTGLVALDKSRHLALGTADNKPLDEDPNRTPRWIAAGATQFLAEDDKYTYALGSDSHILALDKQTGAEVFRSQRSDLAAFATNTKDNIIYASTKAGQVLAIQPVVKPGTMGQVVIGFEPTPINHEATKARSAIQVSSAAW